MMDETGEVEDKTSAMEVCDTNKMDDCVLPQIPLRKMKSTPAKHSIFPPLASCKVKENKTGKQKYGKGDRYTKEGKTLSKETPNISELIREVRQMKKLATEIGLDKEMLVAEREYDLNSTPSPKYNRKRRLSWKNSMKFMKRTVDDSKGCYDTSSQILPPLIDNSKVSEKSQQRHLPVKIPSVGCSYRLPSLRQRSLENDQEGN